MTDFGDIPNTTQGNTTPGLDRTIDRGLPGGRPAESLDPLDWPSLQGHLLVPLDDRQRSLVRALLGIDEAPTTMVLYARRTGIDLRGCEALAERARTRLHERSRGLLTHLRTELQHELDACDGVLDPSLVAAGSMLEILGQANDDPQFPLRLATFCFPHEFYLRGGILLATSPRALRRLVDQLRTILARHRMPMRMPTLRNELEAGRKPVPHGLVLHLLRTELRLAIQKDAEGEVVVPDPRSTAARLAEILEEEGTPMQLCDVVFAYRERFRRVTPHRLEGCLRRHPNFVQVGQDRFALRRDLTAELAEATELADRAIRHVCAEGGKQNVLRWLTEQAAEECSAWLALDHIRTDRRLRLLGRGEACPATQRRSQVMVQLLADFRRACGEVVESMFVQNQPEPRRRLVQRLLAENRMFVRTEPDRIDTLTNYPFNETRLRRLAKIVRKVLEERGGYACIDALLEVVNATDLGGAWLHPLLLSDVLRRQGWFDVLPGGIVALADRTLAAALLRMVRQELRAAGCQLSVDEIVRQRPDLTEFSDCLGELLARDPLVQSPDGRRFSLV